MKLLFSGPHTVGFLGLVALDQLSKWIASISLATRPAIELGLGLSLELVHNSGAAYGLFAGQRWFLLGFSSIVVTGAWIYQSRIGTSALSRLGLTSLMAGAVGNLIDRAVSGHVIDFINIQIVPVFNLADILINIGVMLFIAEFILDYGHSRRQRTS